MLGDSWREHSKRGFTLTELLVVITIIALLAGLLLPCLIGARTKTLQTACANNLHQLGIAVSSYTSDWYDYLPSPKNDYGDAAVWFYAIDCYLLNITPATTATLPQKLAPVKQDPIWLTLDAASKANCRTLKFNRKLVGSRNNTGGVNASFANLSPTYRHVYEILQPSTTPLLLDGRTEESNSTADKSRYDAYETYAALRHFNGANLYFVDGHLAWSKQGAPSGGVGGWQQDSTPWTWWVQ